MMPRMPGVSPVNGITVHIYSKPGASKEFQNIHRCFRTLRPLDNNTPELTKNSSLWTCSADDV